MKMASEDKPTSVDGEVGARTPRPSSDDEDLIGSVLNDTYRVERLVGEGGMSRVYEACHVRIPHKRYALKVLNSDLSRNDELLARFRREAEAVSALHHESIMEVHDVGTTPRGVPFMACEFLDGQDLSMLLDTTGRVDPLMAVRIARKVAVALAAAHARGVVHRDLKPENIFLLGGGLDPEVKVIDFGLSRFVDGSRSTVTRAGVIMGTPSYMSPEQARGERGDHRTDIYGVGALLYTAVTGRPPFEGESAQQTVLAVMSLDPVRPKSLVPTLPDSVELVIQRAMARDIADRYQTMADLAAALTTVEEQLSIGRAPLAQRGTQVSIMAIDGEDDVQWARTRLVLLLLAAVVTTWCITALAAVGTATWIAQRELTNTELILALLGVLGTASTPLILIALNIKRTVWNNSAKVMDAVAGLRGPLVAAVLAYGAAMLALRAVRYVARSGWPSAWVGWDIVFFIIALTWALATVAARAASRWPIHWRRNVGVVGSRALAAGVSVAAFAVALRGMPAPAADTPPTVEPVAAVSTAAASAAASAPPADSAPAAASAAPRTPGLDAEIAAAQREGIAALRALAVRHPEDAQVLRAWAVAAASESTDPREAVTAFVKLFERAPAQANDDSLKPLLIKLASSDGSREPALDLMARHMGSRGPDLLYDLYLTAPQLRESVKQRLEMAATRDLASPAMTVAFDLRNAPSCSARLALLPRAQKQGDERAIAALAMYSTGSKKGCGKWKHKPCPPACPTEAAAFRRTYTEIQKRLTAAAK